MDINKIFNSFNDEEYQEKIKELKDTPQYWIGMFKKLIYNYNNGYSIFMSNLLSSMEDTDDIDKEKVKQSVEYLTYNIAYNYIVKLDITDLTHLYYIILESDNTLLTSLNLCLKYFEDQELYEHCAVLKSIETEVKKSILKFGSPNK
jgi:hypothetical protein